MTVVDDREVTRAKTCIVNIDGINAIREVVEFAENRIKELQEEKAQEFMVGDVVKLREGFPSRNHVAIIKIVEGMFEVIPVDEDHKVVRGRQPYRVGPYDIVSVVERAREKQKFELEISTTKMGQEK